MSRFPASDQASILREATFMARDRTLVIWIVVVFCLSVIAVWSGLAEVRLQQQTIAHLIDADRDDRMVAHSQREDWGSAAYHGFHLTYDLPSDFAFAAMGRRDDLPWKHRVRMLALEGQIYELDAGNPVLALVGRFDFAFLVAFVAPLVLIVLLHDLRAGERTAGRHDLLVATAGSGLSLWSIRAILRAAAVFATLIVPLVVGGWIAGTITGTLLLAVAGVFVYLAFWTLICAWFAAWRRPAEVILTGLIGAWMLLAVIIPAGGRVAIDRMVPIPAGADILLTQREAVNDAWDLPKAVTMEAFLTRHPEWSDHADIERPFEWKWYYAFQQVGDQKTETLSQAYRDGRLRREQMASRFALISPPVLLERWLQGLAGTDVRAALSYEERVRGYHAELGAFFYPRLFRDEPFDRAALDGLPRFFR